MIMKSIKIKISKIPEKQVGITCNYYHLNIEFTWLAKLFSLTALT